MLTQLQALRERSTLLRELEPEALATLASELTEQHYSDGDFVLRESDTGEEVYLVLEGSVQVVLESGDQGEQLLSVLHPGDLLGEVALFFGGRRTSSARAVGEVTLACLAPDTFRKLLQRAPELAAKVGNEVLTRLRRSQLAAHLASLFGPVSAGMLADLEAECRWQSLKGGEVLFRQGDDADKAFIVVSGRLRVTVDSGAGPDAVVNEVARGETVGEAALLADGTRSATVYALRDSHLVYFTRERFAALAGRYPQALMPVTRIVLRRLQGQSGAPGAARSPVTSIAVVGMHQGIALDDFAAELAHCISPYGPIQRLTSKVVDDALGQKGIAQVSEHDVGNVRLVPWLMNLEERARFLLYQADATPSAWTDRCLRQADHVLVVANAAADSVTGPLQQIVTQGRPEDTACTHSLVLLQGDGRASGTARWLSNARIDRHFHVRARERQDYERLARYLTGNAFALVFGGGGARGFAHIGVLRALEELEIPVDFIGGTSMGAIIAALYALGNDTEGVQAICKDAFVKLLDYTFPAVSLLKGERIGRRCREILGRHLIEDLRLPYFAVSTNLTRATQVVHRTGSLYRAVRASISIPGVLPPVQEGDDLLIDGGILNNVPVDVMRDFCGGGRVVAVDVSQPVEFVAGEPQPTEVSGWKLLWQRYRPFGKPVDTPGILSVLQRANDVRSVATRRQRPNAADLYLELPLTEYGLLQFDALDEIADSGYRMALEALRSFKPTPGHGSG